jgi:uncharacterized membrane protein YeiB
VPVNDCWSPGSVTLLVIAGGIATTLVLTWWRTERRRSDLGGLRVLGRTALMRSLVHHVVVVTLVGRGLGRRADGFVEYAAENGC